MSQCWHIKYNDVPCWYEIGFDSERTGIILRIQKDFLKYIPTLSQAAPIVAAFLKQFGFSRFDPDMEGETFGFEGCFKRKKDDGSSIVWYVDIPVFEKRVYVTCSHCQGHKNLLEDVCSWCGGKGQVVELEVCSTCKNDPESVFYDDCHECKGDRKIEKTFMDWQSLYSISATFTLFFQLMDFGLDKENSISNKRFQLITVNTVTIRDMHGASLGGNYSKVLVRWLSSFPQDTEITEMSLAMKKVWTKLFNKCDRYEQSHIYAKVAYQNGWLNVNCPGDACGLHPGSNTGFRPNEGYDFSCHNVDNPMQQLTLLAGLGALCDKVRGALYS